VGRHVSLPHFGCRRSEEFLIFGTPFEWQVQVNTAIHVWQLSCTSVVVTLKIVRSTEGGTTILALSGHVRPRRPSEDQEQMNCLDVYRSRSERSNALGSGFDSFSGLMRIQRCKACELRTYCSRVDLARTEPGHSCEYDDRRNEHALARTLQLEQRQTTHPLSHDVPAADRELILRRITSTISLALKATRRQIQGVEANTM
jgi:hypothetical protein